MAAPRSCFYGSNRRFLPIDPGVAADSMIFELDESDVWSSSLRSMSPEKTTRSRICRKPSSSSSSSAATVGKGRPASLPMNVPDWSKILKDEYRENRHRDEGEGWEEEDGVGRRIPPHEMVARQTARAGIASFSVHEGVGRTLKGRDLSRVRNAVWQKIGFED
ncbi:hypothetical protein M569_14211 [Genlisea aurea]|uniref:Senescence regulator n=1 Tax=Genlisea aurea TaxID=192259 RepID=S8DLW1_9LAMI|nr:hypothetical protein M569_14211 [Genlisea aurea]